MREYEQLFRGDVVKVERLKEILSTLPEIDVERGLSFSVNSIKNYRKALYRTIKSIKFKLPLIQNMMEEREYEGLGVIAHTLTQLLYNIGEEHLAQECIKIETLVLNEKKKELEQMLENFVLQLEGFMFRLEGIMPLVDTLNAVTIEVYSKRKIV